MLRLAAGLPDALVRLLPDRRGAFGLGLDDGPEPAGQPLAAAAVQQDRVQCRSEDVVLALVEGAVSDPDRVRARIAGEVLPSRLGQVAAPVDAVHDLQRAVLVRLEVADELHELVGLPVEVEVVERLEGEGRVADPGEAVVPIALAARGLRKRGRKRRHRGACRHVGESLDRECGTLDRLAEAVVWHPSLGEPAAPVVVVSPRRALASSTSLGEASSSAQERQQKACSPSCSVWRAADGLSSPRGMLLRSRSETSPWRRRCGVPRDHSAGARP